MDSMNCITSSIPHSCVGVLYKCNKGDSERGASAGVVDVAASCSGGGFLLTGGGLLSQFKHSLRDDSKPIGRRKSNVFTSHFEVKLLRSI